MLQRRVLPELLDRLPGDHPDAIHSHRDLRRIHAWMGNGRRVGSWLSRAAVHEPPRRLIDLGAGDGAFLLRCVQQATHLPRHIELVLIDQRESMDPMVLAALRAHGFRTRIETTDALHWLQSASPRPGTWIMASLFLHHFDTPSLQSLLGLIAQQATQFCACEPRRASLPLLACRLLPLIGANPVTRHDAEVSVRAGFRGSELSTLWPAQNGWRLREHGAGPFSHVLFAERPSSK